MSINQEIMTEAETMVFKPVVGFPGYFARDDGSIWSKKKGTLKRLREWIREGRRCVGPYLNGRQIKYPRAYFVLRAFHPAPIVPPGKRLVCRHLDDNSMNDLPGNLAWGTQKENMRDMFYNGKFSLKVPDVWKIRELSKSELTYLEISIIIGCNEKQVQSVLCGGTGGYIPNEDGTKFVPVRRQPFPMDADLKSRVAIDLQAGMPMRKIAKKHGVSKDQVWKFSRNGKIGSSSV
jgi:hypothetical protein